MCGPASVGNANLVPELAPQLDVLLGNGVVGELLQLRHFPDLLDNERTLQSSIFLEDGPLCSRRDSEGIH